MTETSSTVLPTHITSVSSLSEATEQATFSDTQKHKHIWSTLMHNQLTCSPLQNKGKKDSTLLCFTKQDTIQYAYLTLTLYCKSVLFNLKQSGNNTSNIYYVKTKQHFSPPHWLRSTLCAVMTFRGKCCISKAGFSATLHGETCEFKTPFFSPAPWWVVTGGLWNWFAMREERSLWPGPETARILSDTGSTAAHAKQCTLAHCTLKQIGMALWTEVKFFLPCRSEDGALKCKKEIINA